MGGSVTLGGDIRKLTKHLRKLETVDFAAVQATMASAMRTSTRDRFKRETDPDGKKWTQSSRAKAQGGKTLTNTARLKNSIRAKSDADSFAVGTNLIYARRHQFGDKIPLLIKAKTKRGLRFQVGGRWITKGSVKVKMPARPFLGISEDDIETIKSILEGEIASAD